MLTSYASKIHFLNYKPENNLDTLVYECFLWLTFYTSLKKIEAINF